MKRTKINNQATTNNQIRSEGNLSTSATSFKQYFAASSIKPECKCFRTDTMAMCFSNCCTIHRLLPWVLSIRPFPGLTQLAIPHIYNFVFQFLSELIGCDLCNFHHSHFQDFDYFLKISISSLDDGFWSTFLNFKKSRYKYRTLKYIDIIHNVMHIYQRSTVSHI